MITNLGSAQFLDCVEIVMPKLLECVKDESRMVAQKTEEALEALISAIDPPQRCLQVLIPLIITEQSPVLQAAIRCASLLRPAFSDCPDYLWKSVSLRAFLIASFPRYRYRTLSKLVPRMEEEPLLEALPEMLPGLFEAFNDPNADVRKAVVFCLVRRG